MSVARHHAEWLNLVETSGPFLSMPVLLSAFPHGLDQRDPEKAKQLRQAYELWNENPVEPGRHRAWVEFVLAGILEFPLSLIKEGQGLPAGLEAVKAEYGETLRPDLAVVAPPHLEANGSARLLVQVYPPNQNLDKPAVGKHWKASPATRMTDLLHETNVALGLVTNGEQWMLVFAPREETSGYASWYAHLWQEEPITLRAFHSLVHVRRFFGVAENETLLALLQRSAQDQHDVTDQLGFQVRQAVEVLVQALDRLDQDSGRTLLKKLDPKVLYDAALTVMMRLVFLFSAEERGLLRLGQPLYDDNYAVSTLREHLRETADQHGEEILERRFDAWSRLLATFRVVHGGVSHESLRLPAYGGTLFNPDRYPFLEGRPEGSSWRTIPAEPLAVNNRVVLHLLESLQVLQVRVPGGGPAEARKLSFRALDIEQIGHVYEGLLDHTAVRADAIVLGLRGAKNAAPDIPLATLEGFRSNGEQGLLKFLKDRTKRSVSALTRALGEVDPIQGPKLLIACGQDVRLRDRMLPFAGLMREDSFGMPAVILEDSVHVTEGTARRSTGTHYTPRSLTEPIVQYTLEPLVYEGPDQGAPKNQWRLKSPREILALRVCDLAMGSGAFLVQACRYLSERLAESWENVEKNHPEAFIVTPEGDFSQGRVSERLLPNEMSERLAIARRAVADRCLYGVDINPMAVEMAKLSLWLVTLQKDRPFTFLDHALKCGDSLLGLTRADQLENFSLRPEGNLQIVFSSLNLWRHIEEAQKKRETLKALASDTPDQIQAKTSLFQEAEESVAKLKAAADVLISVELMGLKGQKYDVEREMAASQMMAFWAEGLDSLKDFAYERLNGRRTYHWPLAFPEIMEQGGFDALVGNPPFVGGKKITGILGTDYRDFLLENLAQGKKGHADLCAYFFLRAGQLLGEGGMAGLLATNTIAQGDTREVGLDQLVAQGFSIPRAIPSIHWPGVANLEVAHVWLRKGTWEGSHFLNDRISEKGITPFLTRPGKVQGNPFRLAANAGKSFIGSYVLGLGFLMTPEEAKDLIARNPKNADCLFPYLNGEDLNSRPDQSASRWVINFFDWPLSREAVGEWGSAGTKEWKEWLRQGIVPKDYPDPVAADYPDLLDIVIKKVKVERLKNNDSGARFFWWRFLRLGKERNAVISGNERVMARSRVANLHSMAFVSPSMVLNEQLLVLPFSEFDKFSLVQSNIHEIWARNYSSTMRSDMRYSPTDAFETFPFPNIFREISSIGEGYYQHRQSIMLNRQEGLTATYNRFHDPAEKSGDIGELRALHVEMDYAVARAYGWEDLDLGHGFHETRQGVRFTVSEQTRRTFLDRLLELNHQRYAEEVQAGLHDKKKKPKAAADKRGKKTKKSGQEQTGLLFE